MVRIDVAYVLILDETEQYVLMVKNVDNNDLWTLPGGAVEPGESLVQAAFREASEEAGVTVRIGDLVSVNESRRVNRNHHVLFFTFRAVIVEGIPHVVRPEEIGEVAWVDMDTADKHLSYHPGGVRSLLATNCPYVDEDVI